MKKLITSAALIAAIFSFTGCETSKMSPAEKTALEQVLKSKNPQNIENEFLIATANNDTERLSYFTADILDADSQARLTKKWQTRKSEIDKALFDITSGAVKPSRFEVQMVIDQLDNPQSRRVNYIRDVVLPELKKLLPEKK